MGEWCWGEWCWGAPPVSGPGPVPPPSTEFRRDRGAGCTRGSLGCRRSPSRNRISRDLLHHRFRSVSLLCRSLLCRSAWRVPLVSFGLCPAATGWSHDLSLRPLPFGRSAQAQDLVRNSDASVRPLTLLVGDTGARGLGRREDWAQRIRLPRAHLFSRSPSLSRAPFLAQPGPNAGRPGVQCD